MRSLVRTATALVGLLCLTVPGAARAGPLLVDGGWQAFSWTAGPNVFNDGGPFAFTTAAPVNLTVTDAYKDGDRFEVFDFGKLVGTTSPPVDDGALVLGPDLAVLDPKFSHGTFLLTAGAHSIAIENVAVATNHPTGAAFVRADSAPAHAPEPTALALAVVGAAGMAWRLVRRSAARGSANRG